MSAEDHLEQALDDYNVKISQLENSGNTDELIEALINRGTVLMMMESYIAALSDFDEAIDLILEKERNNEPVDLGLFIRAYENRGQLYCNNDNEQMIADYSRIVSKLPELKTSTRYFSLKEIVVMCIACSEDLLDENFPENAVPFLEKAFDMLRGKHDPWAENRLCEASGMMGEIKEAIGLRDEADEYYTQAILTGMSLQNRSALEDRYGFVLSLIDRGDLREARGNDQGMLADYVKAAEFLEELIISGVSDDSQLLVGVCQSIASKMIDMGNIIDSEKYLLKSMKYGIPEMDDAMDVLGLKR